MSGFFVGGGQQRGAPSAGGTRGGGGGGSKRGRGRGRGGARGGKGRGGQQANNAGEGTKGVVFPWSASSSSSTSDKSPNIFHSAASSAQPTSNIFAAQQQGRGGGGRGRGGRDGRGGGARGGSTAAAAATTTTRGRKQASSAASGRGGMELSTAASGRGGSRGGRGGYAAEWRGGRGGQSERGRGGSRGGGYAAEWRGGRGGRSERGGRGRGRGRGEMTDGTMDSTFSRGRGGRGGGVTKRGAPRGGLPRFTQRFEEEEPEEEDGYTLEEVQEDNIFLRNEKPKAPPAFAGGSGGGGLFARANIQARGAEYAHEDDDVEELGYGTVDDGAEGEYDDEEEDEEEVYDEEEQGAGDDEYYEGTEEEQEEEYEDEEVEDEQEGEEEEEEQEQTREADDGFEEQSVASHGSAPKWRLVTGLSSKVSSSATPIPKPSFSLQNGTSLAPGTTSLALSMSTTDPSLSTPSKQPSLFKSPSQAPPASSKRKGIESFPSSALTSSKATSPPKPLLSGMRTAHLIQQKMRPLPSASSSASSSFQTTNKSKDLRFFRRFKAQPTDLSERHIAARLSEDGETLGEPFIGTCMAMCPVKEAKDREEWKDLSVFEMEEGTEDWAQPKVDLDKAVKKYKRPSVNLGDSLATAKPDQVRPPKVLLQTLTYLVHNIMDDKTYPYSEVYGFVRDRTRAIRQDLTLQNISDCLAVFIYEQVARFHIMSDHRLCEQDKVSFDSFQNQEQLDKCLISLRQMYDDLYQEGIECPNEAEFRAYYVLTHLKGDVQETLLTARKEIYHSKEVQFTLRVWEAMKDNNYSAFFRLVKEASYLNACLMHKYFDGVRLKALKTMNRVYARGEEFPLSDLVTLLGFEHEEEAAMFCQHHGLLEMWDDVSGEVPEGVEFKSKSFVVPEEKLKERMSYRLIESKTNATNREIVEGSLGSFTPEEWYRLIALYVEQVSESSVIREAETEIASIEELKQTAPAGEGVWGFRAPSPKPKVQPFFGIQPPAFVEPPTTTIPLEEAETQEDQEEGEEQEGEQDAGLTDQEYFYSESEEATATEDEDDYEEREEKLQILREQLKQKLGPPGVSSSSAQEPRDKTPSLRSSSASVGLPKFTRSEEEPEKATLHETHVLKAPTTTPWSSETNLYQLGVPSQPYPAARSAADKEESSTAAITAPSPAGGLFSNLPFMAIVPQLSIQKAEEKEKEKTPKKEEQRQKTPLSGKRPRLVKMEDEDILRRPSLEAAQQADILRKRKREEEQQQAAAALTEDKRQRLEMERERSQRLLKDAQRQRELERMREKREQEKLRRVEEQKLGLAQLKRKLEQSLLRTILMGWKHLLDERRKERRRQEEERQRRLEQQRHIESVMSESIKESPSAFLSSSARLTWLLGSRRDVSPVPSTSEQAFRAGNLSINMMTPLQAKAQQNALHLYLLQAKRRMSRLSAYYWSSLDIPSLIYPKLPQQPSPLSHRRDQVDYHWKLLLSTETTAQFSTEIAKVESEEIELKRGAEAWLISKFTRGGLSSSDHSNSTFVRTLSRYQTTMPNVKDDRATIKTMTTESKLHICIHLLDFPTPSSEQDVKWPESSLAGADAVLFLLPPIPSSAALAEDYWYCQRKRLTLLVSRLDAQASLPLLVMFTQLSPAPPSELLAVFATIQDKLQISQLPKGKVHYTQVLPLNSYPTPPSLVTTTKPKTLLSAQQQTKEEEEEDTFPFSTLRLKEGVQWLASRKPKPPLLCSATLRAIIEMRVLQHMAPYRRLYHRFFSSQSISSSAENERSPPLHNKRVIALLPDLRSSEFPSLGHFVQRYNAILDCLSKELTNPYLRTRAFPAPEFITSNAKEKRQRNVKKQAPPEPSLSAVPDDLLWNSASTFALIRKAIQRIKLSPTEASFFEKEAALTSGLIIATTERKNNVTNEKRSSQQVTRSRAKKYIFDIFLAMLHWIANLEIEARENAQGKEQGQTKEVVFYGVTLNHSSVTLATEIKSLLIAHYHSASNNSTSSMVTSLLPLPWHRIFEAIFLHQLEEGLSPTGSQRVVYWLAAAEDVSLHAASPSFSSSFNTTPSSSLLRRRTRWANSSSFTSPSSSLITSASSPPPFLPAPSSFSFREYYHRTLGSTPPTSTLALSSSFTSSPLRPLSTAFTGSSSFLEEKENEKEKELMDEGQEEEAEILSSSFYQMDEALNETNTAPPIILQDATLRRPLENGEEAEEEEKEQEEKNKEQKLEAAEQEKAKRATAALKKAKEEAMAERRQIAALQRSVYGDREKEEDESEEDEGGEVRNEWEALFWHVAQRERLELQLLDQSLEQLHSSDSAASFFLNKHNNKATKEAKMEEEEEEQEEEDLENEMEREEEEEEIDLLLRRGEQSMQLVEGIHRSRREEHHLQHLLDEALLSSS